MIKVSVHTLALPALDNSTLPDSGLDCAVTPRRMTMTAIDLHAHCTWVPGTMDRVRVTFRNAVRELPLARLKTQFGREALEALYLKGRHRHTVRADFHLDQL